MATPDAAQQTIRTAAGASSMYHGRRVLPAGGRDRAPFHYRQHLGIEFNDNDKFQFVQVGVVSHHTWFRFLALGSAAPDNRAARGGACIYKKDSTQDFTEAQAAVTRCGAGAVAPMGAPDKGPMCRRSDHRFSGV